MCGSDGGGAGRHLQPEATCGQVTASPPTGQQLYRRGDPGRNLHLAGVLTASLLFAACGGGDSFDAAIQAVNDSPCQRGGPLYVDIGPRQSQEWRIRSLEHPGKEAYVSDVDWRTSHWDVYSGLDEISWASAAVTVVPGCTANRILALERAR